MAKKHHDYARKFSQLGYEFKMNKMNDLVECNGTLINAGIKAEIESRMIDDGYSANRIRRAWIYEAHKARYHPILEYYDGLVWGGQDIFGELMKCFDFEDDNFAQIVWWRFSHGVYGKVKNLDQNFLIVLDGPQGIGKSWLSEWFCPLPQYFVEGPLNPDNKDTMMRIISNLIWEVGELQYTTRKSDIEALKNIITQKRVTVRPPYHEHDIEKPVCCSFIGTINENGAGFLNDPTGTRRFAVVKIKEIDWDRYTRLDKNQLWAQIVTSYQGGERGELTTSEKKMQHDVNSGYTLISSTHELLLKFYEIDPAKYPNDWLPAADILLELHDNGMTGSQKAAQMEIAAIMSKLGIEKSNSPVTTNRGRMLCYRGVRHL